MDESRRDSYKQTVISAKLMARFRNIDWLQPSTIAIIVANLVPIIALFVFHWDVFSLLFLFWLENVIIGVLNVVKMLLAGVGAKDLPRFGWVIFGGMKLFLIPFFCMHYGAFTLVHGMFIVALFGKDGMHQFSGFNYQLIPQLIRDNHLEWPLAALIASNLIVFVWDYLWSGEFRRTNPAELMAQPYRRVMLMHITVIIGGFLMMALKLPEAALIFLVALKTITDLWGHQHVREKVETKTIFAPATSTVARTPSIQGALQTALQMRAAQTNRKDLKNLIPVIAIVVIVFGGGLCFAAFVTYNMVSSFFVHSQPVPRHAPAAIAKKTGPEWTTNATQTLIPETPAAGKFRGSGFRANRGVLAGGVLTLSDTTGETNRAFIIHFTPEQINATANRIFKIGMSDIGDVPQVQLVSHARNSNGTDVRTFHGGYSMQWNFGVKSRNRVPLRIYLSLPDEEKSFVAGTFKVAIKKDKAATETAGN